MKVSLSITTKPFFTYKKKDLEIYVYGNIYNDEILSELTNYNKFFNLTNFIKKLSGYFLLIIKNKDLYLICNDIFGNYRTYIRKINQHKTIYISDDFNKLKKIKTVTKNISESIYFKRHRYTTGGRTLFNEIDKMMPATVITIKKNIFYKKIYFKHIFNPKKNKINYLYENINLINRNLIQPIKNNCYKNILLFTGGIDSTVLLTLLIKNNIKFDIFFFRFDIPDSDNQKDLLSAKRMARYFKKRLNIVDYPIDNSKKNISLLSKTQPMDVSVDLMYFASKVLHKKFGYCNIINGQSSDSIYCWGLSSFNLSSFLQRIAVSSIFMSLPKPIRLVYTKLLYILYSRRDDLSKITIPYEGLDYLVGLLDPNGYLPVNILNEKYHKYLLSIIKKITPDLGNDKKILLLYLKMMYLQGPSNIPLINSANIYGHQLVMPFLDANLIRLIYDNQNSFKVITNPRYELTSFLINSIGIPKKLLNKNTIKFNENLEESKKFNQVIKKLYKQYFLKIYDC